MSGMVPYRQPQSGQMNYAQLMQMLQMKQMMDAQQQQGQAKAPSTSGLSDLLSSFGGGAAASSMMGGGSAGAVPTTQLADILSMGQTMPSVGPTVGNAAQLPAAQGIGAGPLALGALALGATASNIYEGGAKDIIRGKGKGEDYANLMLDVNPMTAPINFGLRALGMKSAGKMLLGGGKSTKERQSERWQGLAKDGKAPESAFANGINQDMGVDDKKLASGKLGGRDVWATSGMFDTFGKDWATTGDENKREQVAKLMLDNKLFDTRKGVTNVTDKNKAMDIYNQVMGGNSQQPQTRGAAPISIQNLPGIQKGPNRIQNGLGQDSGFNMGEMNKWVEQQQAPVRKDSPGFKDGKRIDYSRR